jgi:hypothetical protein
LLIDTVICSSFTESELPLNRDVTRFRSEESIVAVWSPFNVVTSELEVARKSLKLGVCVCSYWPEEGSPYSDPSRRRKP